MFDFRSDTRRSSHREESFLSNFISNLRDVFAADLLAKGPRESAVTDLAGNVLWKKDPQFVRVEALSIAIHVTILTLLVLPLLPNVVSVADNKPPYSVSVGDLPDFLKHLKAPIIGFARKPKGGGGSGDRNPAPESQGALAPFARIQLTPPRVRTPENSMYPVRPEIIGLTELKQPGPEMNNWGNPVAQVINNSDGPGSGNSIGEGKGHGVGPGDGDGYGPGHDYNFGGDYPEAATRGYSALACLYCPQAQFSDDAVKTKYEGTVFLSIIVTADGRVAEVHVSRGLGMGLDEKAVEAVRKWRFTPSVGPDGKAAVVRAIVEVHFHLY